MGTRNGRSLEQLLADERSLSARRRRLQNRIDFLRSGGRGPDEDVSGEIADLVLREQAASRERQELHDAIERARAELLRDRA